MFDGELKAVCYILILCIFCSYEFVKYLRQYINNTVGSVIEEETEKCTSAQSQGEVSGYDTLVQHVTKKTRESKEWVYMCNSRFCFFVVFVFLSPFQNLFSKNRFWTNG